ncbi:hypothetical protein ANN_01682 [Periplaneta americana]|uniref:V-type proton ATPase subunit a n=1 Tax=Periplaneta americana TaxID=6978 RepID=A0ABQ8TW04_PERAM|nr:hypothetical protein ANN_01682 [Periplaneta americana]
MGSFFRSEEMSLCQLFIQPEAAYSSVAELGEAGSVQFRDLNVEVNSFQRKFVNEVRRCDELERKLRYIEAELNKENLPIPEIEDLPNAPNPREITDLEVRFVYTNMTRIKFKTSLEKTENEILELSQNAVNLKSNFLELTELRHVLEKTESFFNEREGVNGTDSLTRALISEDPATQATNVRGRLGFVAGVVPRERVPGFERMLWRISRGNVFLRQVELEEPLEDPNTVLNQTQDHRQRVLISVAKELQNWMVMVRKMKAIYHTLNMFNLDVTKKCLIAECWVPVKDLPGVQKALADGSIWNIFFAGRYIILLMGLFSIYTGVIYNDVFSKSMNIFGSSWTISGYNGTDLRDNVFLTLSPYDSYENFSATSYPLGLDPIWQSAENKIIFLNSYKMKLSIIFGVVHMIFGVCLSVVNHVLFLMMSTTKSKSS